MTKITWTDEQLQGFLETMKDMLPSSLNGIILHHRPSPTLPFPAMTYLLELPDQIITLTQEQSEKVSYWLQIYFPPSSFTYPVVLIARDTQFLGFAKLLLAEMFKVKGKAYLDFASFDEEDCAEYERLFTRRAYDLACHVASELLGGSSPDAFVQTLPDLCIFSPHS